ncbi:glucose 1-dehydrogenase [Brevibacterium ravenspurgense]|uniref:SDR family NAD(P)-dependent oxidoreductase n=1 Tax=Brevibacterium ravenspurgense TaxID=479117 RepID=UPI001EF20067|nr:glucose 1-dehydrogenase [Brevibacterium ravenspurgense]MCG7300563.1 glucose 1-dehydrogenase [Brevibacterium ravenspurgense]
MLENILDETAVPTPQHPELEGKTVVVTGAAQGMGACFAAGLMANGARVVALDIDLKKLDATADALRRHFADRGTITTARVDVSSRAELADAAAKAAELNGSIHGWVNNAGIFPQGHSLEVDDAQFDRTFDINVGGVLFGAQAAAKHMGDGGRVVNMASVAAFRVRPGRVVYSATKAAVDNLTKGLAVEFGHKGIRVNAIAPGFIDTEMTNWVRETPGAMDKALSSIPLGFMASPRHVMAVMLFLLADASAYVSGHTIAVDGGSRHG